MDEPLSNLDAKLRVQMRTEISKLHQRLQTTFIYVTHDQTEAMTMGTRIVVMKDGVVQQVADPQTIYQYPANMFVATFIGSPQMNLIQCEVKEKNDKLYMEFDGNSIEISEDKAKTLKDNNYVNKNVIMGIRPESISVESSEVKNTIRVKVEVAEMLGSETYLYLNLDGNNIIARVDPSTRVKIGKEINISFDMDKIHLFDKKTEKAIF